MPNFDSGTYFLTVLAPVDNRGLVAGDPACSSPVHMLREYLETLPTALQSVATQRYGQNSPFSRNTRTHFVRLVVIDGVAYNGREQPTTLYSTIAAALGVAKANPVLAQKADQLSCPYLLFVADFDAANGERRELAAYLALLWETMEDELREIFEYCRAFETVASAHDFVAYIEKCQIETTMPFHDYWEDRPKLGDYPVPGWKLALPLVPAVLWAGGILLLHGLKWLGPAAGLTLPAAGAWLGLSALLLAAGVWFALRQIRGWSQRPFPPPPDATLPHVLKALYLQRKLAGFAMDNQASGPARLHEAFGAFLKEHDPAGIACPAQPAGTIP